MTFFAALSPLVQALFPALFLIVKVGILFRIALGWTCRPRAARVAPLLLLAVTGSALALFLYAQHEEGRVTELGAFLGNLPWAFPAAILLVAAVGCGLGLRREFRAAARSITTASIREALDNLPSGLSFADAAGVPQLTNRQFYALAEGVGGHFFRNGHVFWQELQGFSRRQGIVKLQGGDRPVLRWPDGSVWRFSRRELALEGVPCIQITATDITALYNLTQDLARSNTALAAQRRRLQQLAQEIATLQREEEILNSKVKIHNELGQCLLVGRRYLTEPESDLVPLLALWGEAIKRLTASAEETAQGGADILQQIIDLAKDLGCTVVVEGQLPANEENAYLLLTALQEGITNAVRHAQAQTVTLRIKERESRLFVDIFDDGKVCPVTIVEGGGLSSLRRRLRKAGGQLTIFCDGGVHLHLQLPLTTIGKGAG